VPLIITPRHTDRDLAHWRTCEKVDALTAQRRAPRLREMAARAGDVAAAFARGGGYAGVSWGKDSVVVASILAEHRTDLPLVWVRVDAWENPDCELVRDAFLARFDVRYHEIRVAIGPNRHGGTLSLGFAEAAERFGARYISGVRADESAIRRASMGHHGITTKNTCRPIGKWSTADVFAYCALMDLPLHPAYGYTMGGIYDRMRLRTASLGGVRGAGHGRAEWERVYYGVRHEGTQRWLP